MAGPNWKLVANLNNLARQHENGTAQSLVLRNVLFFDGQCLKGPTNIYILNGKIVEECITAETLECQGKYLIPGFIDAHTHPMLPKDLAALTKHGITTTMSMAGFDSDHMASLKNHKGFVDVLVAGLPAAGPENHHTKQMPGWPMDEVLTTPDQAEEFVKKQVEKGAEYIKLLADVPGLNQDILSACVTAAKKQNLLTVCHAAGIEPARQALHARTHQLHHVALDGIYTDADVGLHVQNQVVLCPTLMMMKSVVNNLKRPGQSFEVASKNVGLLHAAGIPVLCGTDANEAPGAPASVPFGSSIHHELELLVAAGLSPIDALRSATISPATHFGLPDRGEIKPGFRADLVLLSENPLTNIKATKSIEKVWVNGILYV